MANYYWYTLWRIVKEYNGKNGCIITKTPKSNPSGNSALFFEIDWSEKAKEYVTGEKAKREAKEKNGIGLMIWFGFVVTVAVYAIFICFLRAFFIKDVGLWEFIENNKYFIFSFAFFIQIFFCTLVRKYFISYDLQRIEIELKTHFKNIQETKASKFDLNEGIVNTKFCNL